MPNPYKVDLTPKDKIFNLCSACKKYEVGPPSTVSCSPECKVTGGKLSRVNFKQKWTIQNT